MYLWNLWSHLFTKVTGDPVVDMAMRIAIGSDL